MPYSHPEVSDTRRPDSRARWFVGVALALSACDAGGSSEPGDGGAGFGPAGGGPSVSLPALGDRFVGNITTEDAVDVEGRTFATYWSQITPENAGKWGSVQPSAGAGRNFATLDAIYDHAQKNGLIFKQHAFVWGNQQPSGELGEADVRSWITEFCQRYPETKLIDVVNEPPPHTTPTYADAIGGGTDGSWQWIINAFKWAREACPNAILILNDYNNIEWQNDSQHFIDIVKVALAGGAPIDAIGAQAHDLDHAQVTPARVATLLQKLNQETGLPVYITELDLSYTDDAVQLDAYQRYLPVLLTPEYVKGLTLWGWIYGKTWSQAEHSGLIRNGVPRPAMTWLMQELGRPAP